MASINNSPRCVFPRSKAAEWGGMAAGFPGTAREPRQDARRADRRDTLIKSDCQLLWVLCQGGVVGYPKGLWIPRPGFESRPWPSYFCSDSLSISLHNLVCTGEAFTAPTRGSRSLHLAGQEVRRRTDPAGDRRETAYQRCYRTHPGISAGNQNRKLKIDPSSSESAGLFIPKTYAIRSPAASSRGVWS